MKAIKIISNGSKWAGEEPDSLEVLKNMLKNYKLDVYRFARLGFVNFREDDTVGILGNFKEISHVFNIEGDADSLGDIIDLIGENILKQS